MSMSSKCFFTPAFGKCASCLQYCSKCHHYYCFDHIGHKHRNSSCYFSSNKCTTETVKYCSKCYHYYCGGHMLHKHECSYINCHRAVTSNDRCVYHGNKGVMHDNNGNITYHGMP